MGMPMANPDGFIHSEGWSRFHRKNMNLNYTLCQSPAIWTAGVDLNRNFPFMWNQGGSSSIPCLDNYHGQEGGSEAETQVIMRVLQESPMSVMIDVHSFTQLVLSSWGYTTEDHPRKEEFAELGGKMKDAMEARHGAWFSEGPAAQTLYVASGTLTDYATSLGALGYCFELRPARQLHLAVGRGDLRWNPGGDRACEGNVSCRTMVTRACRMTSRAYPHPSLSCPVQSRQEK